MRMQQMHRIVVGAVSLVLAGCARLVPPDSIVALEVGPQEVNVVVGATQPLNIVGTRGDGRTVTITPRQVRFESRDPSVARVTPDGAVKGLRLGRTSISATLETPSGAISVQEITVAVGAMIARTR